MDIDEARTFLRDHRRSVLHTFRNPGPGVAPSRFVRKSPELGPAFLKELFAPGNVKLSSDQRQLIDWVAQGTYPVGLFMDPGEVAIAIKQGLPITIVPPDQFKEGAAIGPNNAGVALFDTQHPPPVRPNRSHPSRLRVTRWRAAPARARNTRRARRNRRGRRRALGAAVGRSSASSRR